MALRASEHGVRDRPYLPTSRMGGVTDLLPYDEDTAFALADDAATVSALVRRAGAERLRAPRFGQWSALEVIGHLADAAEIFAERIRRCIEEDEPAIASFDQDAVAAERGNASADPVELSGRLQQAHGQIVQLLQTPGSAERTGVHAEWGRVTAGHFAAYEARHSRGHIAELAEAFPPHA